MPILSYGRALSRNAERKGEAIAFVHDGRATTHAELEAGANRLARAYAKRGVAEGDFVTIALPNGVEFVEALFACWKLGATPQPVSPRLPLHERDTIIELVDPRLIVGVDSGERAGRKDSDVRLRRVFARIRRSCRTVFRATAWQFVRAVVPGVPR